MRRGLNLKDELARLAEQQDPDLAEAALVLAALDHPRRDRQPYRALLAAMAVAVEVAARGIDSASGRAEVLAEVLAGQFQLLGGGHEGEDLPDADLNLMNVLDRRRGLPACLGIIWLHVGKKLGWNLAPLDFPGQVLLRLTDLSGGRVILDPSNGGRTLAAHDLRGLLKAGLGLSAELEPAHTMELSGREMLMRLLALVKIRYLRLGHLGHAAQAVEAALVFSPQDSALWREYGLLQLRQGNLLAAVDALEQFVARAPNSTARHRTSVLLQELRDRLT